MKKEPKTKYNFDTGETIKKVKKFGYKYCGRGDTGKLCFEMIDGKKFYYINYDIGRSSFSRNKKKFVKVESWEEDINWRTKWVEKKKGKSKLIFNTNPYRPRDRWLRDVEIKLGKKDSINFYDIKDSNIIRDLQLKLGDKLKITIEKIK